MAWTNATTTKTAVTKLFLDEVRQAIATHDGIAAMTSSGVTISFTADYATTTVYQVLRQWEASAVSTAGTLEVSKATNACTIFELGAAGGVGQLFAYTVKPIKVL